MQWVGVGLVFGAVGGEAVMNKREKSAKAKIANGIKVNGVEGKKEL